MQAAIELFERQGYVATTVGDIAAAAQTAVQTVYSAYGSKVGVLAAAHDVALAGDEEPVPIAEREWFRALAEASTAAEAWRCALEQMQMSTARVAPIYTAMMAAEADPDVAALMRSLRAQRAEFSRLLVDQVAGRPGGEQVDRARVADLVYATESVESYSLLVTQCGWSREQWRDWVHDLVALELRRDAGRPQDAD
ncbi:TetR/AcrR family transcriptional regulator [Nocardioides antri]|uniref:TetR/AcrR family transcriptional regulator n=1 Tax=Nocardioides antri TaxID=2607659 RepID=UPI00165EF292|nr:TetR family transcriptional regulator [Nocardioides antri]